MTDRAWHEPILIVGATSGIARALAEQLARRGHDLLLAGRDQGELEAIGADLQLRFQVRTAVLLFDAHNPACCAGLMAGAAGVCDEKLRTIIACHGMQLTRDEASPAAVRQMIEVNYSSYIDVLEAAGAWLVERGGGMIVALSSVAGDRGRPSNDLYGSTKAGLSAYLQGLRARLARSSVHVMTVKPGVVATPMTWGLPVKGPVAAPQRVAADIVRAMDRRRNVLYTPWFWRPIMAVIRAIPEPIFKRLDL